MDKAKSLPSRWAGLHERVPDSLDNLHGPASGVVRLPEHLAWSGLHSFDLADQALRLSMYRTVISGGGRVDAETYLNASLLATDWPVLRMGIGPSYRSAWEDKLPGLRVPARHGDDGTATVG